jgi:hypothetical protein
VQIYPVPGSQVAVSTLPALALGLVCLGDAAASLASLAPLGRQPTVRAAAERPCSPTSCASRGRATGARLAWREAEDLDLPGARRLRAQPAVRAGLRELVAKIQVDCPRLVLLPGPQSLYFLANKAALTPALVPQTTRILRDEDIARLVAAIDEAPTCLLRCRTAAGEPNDPRVLALYARAQERWTSGICTLFDLRPPSGGEAGRVSS